MFTKVEAQEFLVILEEWREEAIELFQNHESHIWRWKLLHSPPDTLLGSLTARWLPAPSASALAGLSDLVESQKDPQLRDCVAALLQRAARYDLEVIQVVWDVMLKVHEVGNFRRGSAGVAIQAHRDLDRLLEDPRGWNSPEEVLGEAYSHPEDLLRLAWIRLLDEPDQWRDPLIVITKLSGVAGRVGENSLSEEQRAVQRRRSVAEQLAFLGAWAERAGLDEDEIGTRLLELAKEGEGDE